MARNGAAASVKKEFKYRSIDDLAKKQILEINRRQLEEQHFAASFRLQVLRGLPAVEDEQIMTQREGDVKSIEESCAIWEGMIDRYNDELLTINESISANETKE